MTERKDIGWRLENWARHFRDRQIEAHGKSSTAVICHQMQEAALGHVYDRENGISPVETPDSMDATKIERGMRYLSDAHRILLWWCYIKQQHPGYIARSMCFPVKYFVERFREAQEAIEDVVDGGNR